MPKKFVQPFRTGDVVQYVGKESWWGIGEEHIINECSVENINHYEYSTNRGAWIPHKEFKLLRECDEASLRSLLKTMSDEEDDYNEEL